MRRDPKYRRGRSRTKKTNRFRDLSTDPIYPKKKNYNKVFRQHGETPFTWNKKCNFANRIYRNKNAILEMNKQTEEYYEENRS